jgi:hypothetical protein
VPPVAAGESVAEVDTAGSVAGGAVSVAYPIPDNDRVKARAIVVETKRIKKLLRVYSERVIAVHLRSSVGRPTHAPLW